MKAVVKNKPEKGAVFSDVPNPTNPPPGNVIVKIRATSICGTDVHIWNWDEWSNNRIGAKSLPQILGHEFAGEVVEVGPYCTRVKVGDYVSAETHIYDDSDLTTKLGILHIGNNMKIVGVDADGCFAEYICVPEKVLWKNDKSVAPELACIQEPLGNATYAVLGEDNDIYGKTLLLTGDGPISLFAVGVAKAAGASKIIQFGMADLNMAIGKKMGADIQVFINKTTPEEQKQIVMDATGGWGVDVALEMVGYQSSIDACLSLVRKGGRLTAFGVSPTTETKIDYTNGIVFKGLQIHGVNGRKIFDTWYRNGQMLAAGKLDPTPVITHVLPLRDFKNGFDLITANPRQAAKVVMFPDDVEYEAAKKRMNQ
ncbi:MAG TPA: alcohol dehydrogenase catalytic domain-containing protein [Caldisericia bacterium]|nr:alcohol dehydrogenase catalytic domain-containing protein [Caldisericia bacterium]HPF48125.1 alcohol dehydrogenase catalytic domain-containing protein [Caldisericia bacterium]HPI83938.1 alcohol dehydrogenase catalytic domain-containing protein [Caldisericia bacterium]HPQ92578.1 alcohol dehydrogenase catalytic domain-containing protein [Caldisericia bacterium]HRV74324.1 alcohol dehydrogenase catalytic domain-containing protein [Caldisericia bacterium]